MLESKCPHVASSDEGTNYCTLGEDYIKKLEAELKAARESIEVLKSQDSVARTAEALTQSANELQLLLPYVNEIRALRADLKDAREKLGVAEAAIEKALNDEESGNGWGPDVTVCTYLNNALTKIRGKG